MAIELKIADAVFGIDMRFNPAGLCGPAQIAERAEVTHGIRRGWLRLPGGHARPQPNDSSTEIACQRLLRRVKVPRFARVARKIVQLGIRSVNVLVTAHSHSSQG